MLWLLTLLIAGMFIAFYPLPADDAFIVGRYVRHLYDGDGLVFNSGERINAVTSPLLTFVIAAFHAVSRDPVDTYRVAASLLTACTLVVISRNAYITHVDRLLFLGLTLASPFVCFWAIGGLETPLVLCACSFIAALALSSSEENSGTRAAQVVWLSTIAVLARYDSALFVAPVTGFLLLRYRSDRRVIAIAIGCAAVVAGWIAFTYLYYDDILPTSFYVKMGDPGKPGELLRGIVYMISFSILALVVPVAVTMRIWNAKAVSAGDRPLRRMLWLGVLLEGIYAIFAGDKHMMYAYRLFVPYLPSLILLLLKGDSGRQSASSRPRRRVLWLGLILGYQFLTGLFLYYWSENPNLSLAFRKQGAGNEIYEFSTSGAKYTGTFLAAVRASTSEVQAHWDKVSESRSRPMRIAVLTGGTLPYSLPDAYILETLVSYRHHCSGNFALFADYVQIIQNADAPLGPRQIFGEEDRGWELVSKHELTVRGLQDNHYRVRIDIWHQPHPAPVIFPPMVNQPCMGA